jgi:hypothetical protein
MLERMRMPSCVFTIDVCAYAITKLSGSIPLATTIHSRLCVPFFCREAVLGESDAVIEAATYFVSGILPAMKRTTKERQGSLSLVSPDPNSPLERYRKVK